MAIPLEVVLLALLVPFVAWLWWMNSEREVFQGQGHAVVASAYVGTHGYAFVSIMIGDGMILAEITPERAKALSGLSVPVSISVRQRAFSKPWIQTIRWPDGETVETSRKFEGLYISGYYLLLGLFLMTGLAWTSAIAFVMGGYIVGNVMQAHVKIDGHQGQIISFAIFSLLLAFGCVVLFTHMSILTLLLGVNLAFALGQLTGILARTRWKAVA